jgi:hypothetical protein
MPVPRFLPVVCSVLLAAGAAHAQAPTVSSDHLISWEPPIGRGDPVLSRQLTALDRGRDATRSHAATGLLVGGIVGVAATGAFLALFCSDPDTSCGADEVGRVAVVFIPPPALLGALIGSLVDSDD